MNLKRRVLPLDLADKLKQIRQSDAEAVSTEETVAAPDVSSDASESVVVEPVATEPAATEPVASGAVVAESVVVEESTTLPAETSTGPSVEPPVGTESGFFTETPRPSQNRTVSVNMLPTDSVFVSTALPTDFSHAGLSVTTFSEASNTVNNTVNNTANNTANNTVSKAVSKAVFAQPAEPSGISNAEETICRKENRPESNLFSDYDVAEILASVLSGKPDEQIRPLLQTGLEQSKRRNDAFYSAIFEGAVAAHQTPLELHRAVECFRRAFDLSAGQRDGTDGFLHSMLWDLFTRSGGDVEVAKLLDRARLEFEQSVQWKNNRTEEVRQTLEELEKNADFKGARDRLRERNDKTEQQFRQRVLRESRLAGNKTLLFFPGSMFENGVHSADDASMQNVPFQKKAEQAIGGNYFLLVNGNGTVLNPTVSFLDDLYRLGGTLADLRNIVFSSAVKVDSAWFRQAEAVFSMRNTADRVRLIVSADVAGSFGEELVRLEATGSFEIFRFRDRCGQVFSANETELVGGGFITLNPGLMTLKYATEQGRVQVAQFLDALDAGIGSSTFGSLGNLLDGSDVLVVAANGSDGLLQSLGSIRRTKPNLVVFDVPKTAFELTSFAAPFRSFSETVFAFALPSLVCDLKSRRFLDIVKAFRASSASSSADCWSDFGKMASLPVVVGNPTGPKTGLFYFDVDSTAEFHREKADIVESFLFEQRRRRGLYFV